MDIRLGLPVPAAAAHCVGSATSKSMADGVEDPVPAAGAAGAEVAAALAARARAELALRELSACVGRVQTMLSADWQEHRGAASVLPQSSALTAEDSAGTRSCPASFDVLPVLAEWPAPAFPPRAVRSPTSPRREEEGCGSSDDVLLTLGEERRGGQRYPSGRESEGVRDAAESEEDVVDEKQTFLSIVTLVSAEHCVNAETLPDTWPGSLEARWPAEPDPISEASPPSRKSSRQGWRNRRFSNSSAAGLDDQPPSPSASPWGSHGPRRKAWFVLSPNSRGRMAFDVVGAALLGFDALAIPLMIAWDVSPVGALYHMAWVTAVFWTLDIFLSFVTAVQVGDECICDVATIAQSYLRTWFIPDTIIVLCDWLSLVVTSSASWRTFRLAKVGRLLRILALFRLLKFIRVLSDLIEERLSDCAQLTFRFGKMICVTLAYAHVISCAWFFIGRAAPTDTGVRWIDSRGLVEESMAYQYATSFHWAMSQITLGAIEIPSNTLIERVYSIVCLITGLLFGSTLVSTLSATMLEAQMDRREAHLKMQMMRRYLRENRVDGLLAARVERQLAERLAARDKIKEEQVVGLQLLSSSLRSQLHFHMFAPHLRRHALFHLWIDVDSGFVEHLCRRSVDFVHLRTQDDLFTAGKVAECAYFFIVGRMTYTQEPASSAVNQSTTQDVGVGCWMVEAALWSRWIHVGTARATRFTEAARVRVEDLMEAMQRSTTVCQLTGDYCRQFHRRLQAAKPPMLDWPDDLQVPLTDWGEMVLAMSLESQTLIGLEALRQAALRRTWLKASSGLDKLTEEVKAGRSSVMLNSEGEMERVASVVAFKILNQDGQVLVQIGKQESGAMKPTCQLPGGKTDRGELAIHAMERLLATRLASMSGHVQVIGTDRETQWQESKEYGVRTKYLRHIVICTLTNDSGLEGAKLPDVSLAVNSPCMHKARSLSPMQQMRSLSSNASRLPTDKSATSQPSVDARRNLCQRSLFRVADTKGGCALYGWFSEHEFELLRGPVGDRLLPAWIAAQQARMDIMEPRDGVAFSGRLGAPVPKLLGYGSETEPQPDLASDGRDGTACRHANFEGVVTLQSPRARPASKGAIFGRASMVSDLAGRKKQVWI